MASYYASNYHGNDLGGRKWNDGTFSRVKRITMTANEKTLTSLKVHYGLDGHDTSVHGITFGGIQHGGVNAKVTEYDFESDEFLIKLTGYFGKYGEYSIVKSLTFETNLRKLEPVGPLDGTKFETDVNGKIVGFFGSASDGFIDSIGVYMLLT
uniref:Jacalin-type lectin domain-containing protein n=1 Tax=Picea sitchensis TaxID=3332 RepID=A9NR04_PICSI|nr:unknown [Picea sitchensis]